MVSRRARSEALMESTFRDAGKVLMHARYARCLPVICWASHASPTLGRSKVGTVGDLGRGFVGEPHRRFHPQGYARECVLDSPDLTVAGASTP